MAGLFEDRARLGGLRGGDDGDAGLDDAGLLAGDLRERGPEFEGVVIAEASDGAGPGLKHIGRVEAAAQAGFSITATSTC